MQSATTIKYTLILACLLLLSSCKKNEVTPVEDDEHVKFYFSGIVRNCITGKPVTGTKISVEAYWDSMLFGKREEVGNTASDRNGMWLIKPKVIDGYFEKYIISYYYPNGHREVEYFTLDSIRSAQRSNYILDLRVVELGCIKLNLHNTHAFDTADVIYLKYYQDPMPCSYNPPVVASDPKATYNFGFKGIIHNGFVYRSVWADDSVKIGWRVLRNGDTSVEQFLSTYARVNDTTVIDLNY
ncbi:MAG: hypothetical protein K0R82_550 [Flavipsychrobacter sp.]|jgi:hypothetical protein|nr:hypothetical protein [Flavipsychrobacter sp.]